MQGGQRMTERLVVVGGDAAGMSAAAQARKRRDPKDLAIVVFERGNYISYSACGIPYFVGGVVNEVDSLITRSPGTFRDKLAIDARLGQAPLVQWGCEPRRSTSSWP
jgi:NADPH-dependent 2,4-dienoyl-CoA reductase/sulfur reductase-like enzyme